MCFQQPSKAPPPVQQSAQTALPWYLFANTDLHLLTCDLLKGNPRSTAIRAVAQANNLKLDIEHTEPAKGVSQDYLKLNKLGKVPTFEGQDGYILSECIAIAIYGMSEHFYHYYTTARTTCLVSRACVTGRAGGDNDEQSYYHLQLSLSEDYC